MKKSDWERAREILVIVVGLVFFILLVWSAFKPVKPQYITFNITGVSESINASTLTQVHYECIKYCSYSFHSDGSARNSCYSECSKLGKENCNEP